MDRMKRKGSLKKSKNLFFFGTVLALLKSESREQTFLLFLSPGSANAIS